MTGQTGMPSPASDSDDTIAPSKADYYFEKGLLVYTEAYHLKRGFCCGSGCRHCPYEPKHVEGSTQVRPRPVIVTKT